MKLNLWSFGSFNSETNIFILISKVVIKSLSKAETHWLSDHFALGNEYVNYDQR